MCSDSSRSAASTSRSAGPRRARAARVLDGRRPGPAGRRHRPRSTRSARGAADGVRRRGASRGRRAPRRRAGAAPERAPGTAAAARYPDDLPLRERVTGMLYDNGRMVGPRRAAVHRRAGRRDRARATGSLLLSANAGIGQDLGAVERFVRSVARGRRSSRAGSWRSRSPTRRRASCARASAGASSSWAARPRTRPRGRLDLDDPRLLRADAARPRGRRRPRSRRSRSSTRPRRATLRGDARSSARSPTSSTATTAPTRSTSSRPTAPTRCATRSTTAHDAAAQRAGRRARGCRAAHGRRAATPRRWRPRWSAPRAELAPDDERRSVVGARTALAALSRAAVALGRRRAARAVGARRRRVQAGQHQGLAGRWLCAPTWTALDGLRRRVARRAGAPRAIALLDELLARYADAYAAAKRARAALDFDDLELLARDLLRDTPAIRGELRRALRARDGRRVPGHQRRCS